MAITPIHRLSRHLPVNPYCVYYLDPGSPMRRSLIESGTWWTEEQGGWIRDYLDVPPEFGDPLVAVMLCAVGYEKHYEDCTMWMCGLDDKGEFVRIDEVLGREDAAHVWRCRNAAYKMRDAVEWQCLNWKVGNIDMARRYREKHPNGLFVLWGDDDAMPGQLPWPSQLTLPVLLTWANRQRIPMTEAGSFKWVEVVRSGCPALLPVAKNEWAQDPEAPLTCSEGDKFNEARGVPVELVQISDPLKDVLFYMEGWTPELGDRLRAALRAFGKTVDGDPVEGQTPEASAAPVGDDAAAVPAPGQPPTKRTLAEELKVTEWRELEMKVLATGVDFRRAGTDEKYIRKTWGALGLKAKLKVYGLLINVAKHGGTYPRRTGEPPRRDETFELNEAFCEVFGLRERPFGNKRRLGTQSVIGSITWGGQA